MIKIKRKVQNKLIDAECNHCGTELTMELEDTRIGAHGNRYYICPVCNTKNIVDTEDEMGLTVENIEFPKHFIDFKDGKDISPEEIEKYIKDGIKFFRQHPDQFAWYITTGNTFVTIFNDNQECEYYIVVSKGHYETYIPYETIDYELQDEVSR